MARDYMMEQADEVRWPDWPEVKCEECGQVKPSVRLRLNLGARLKRLCKRCFQAEMDRCS